MAQKWFEKTNKRLQAQLHELIKDLLGEKYSIDVVVGKLYVSNDIIILWFPHILYTYTHIYLHKLILRHFDSKYKDSFVILYNNDKTKYIWRGWGTHMIDFIEVQIKLKRLPVTS